MAMLVMFISHKQLFMKLRNRALNRQIEISAIPAQWRQCYLCTQTIWTVLIYKDCVSDVLILARSLGRNPLV
jgi:hypothetical protein